MGPGTKPLQANPLQPYANARILLFSNQLPGVLSSARTGRFLFEAFVKCLRQISAKDNGPGVDTGDFACEGYLTRGVQLPMAPEDPWDWLSRDQSWITAGLRPFGEDIPELLAPCSGVIWLGDLTELSASGQRLQGSRGQLAAFAVNAFGGPYGPGGIGRLSQPLLGERIEAAIKPNQVVVIASGDSLVQVAERYGTTVAALRALNPDLMQQASEVLPEGSWLFIPRYRQPASSTSAVGIQPLLTPAALAEVLGVTTATLEDWRAIGYGPPSITLGNLVRYRPVDVEAWLERQIEAAAS